MVNLLSSIKLGKYLTGFLRQKSLNNAFLPENAKIILSKNPFLGDRAEINGIILANGPKSLSRQFNKMGFLPLEYESFVKEFGDYKDFITRISGEIVDLPKQCLSSLDSRKILISNLKSFGNHAKKNPELLSKIKGYKNFLTERFTQDISLSTESVLNQGVTDFTLITNMLKPLEGTNLLTYRNIPKIAKQIQDLPDGNKIFEYSIRLTKGSGHTEFLCSGSFEEKILKSLGKDSEGAGKFLEEIYRDSNKYEGLTMQLLEDIVKHGKRTQYANWNKNFITDYIALLKQKKRLSMNLPESLESIHSERQAKCLITHLKGKNSDKAFKNFTENGLLENDYQTEVYNYLTQSERNIKDVLFTSKYRFSNISKAEILKHVKTELDAKLVKAMVDRRSVRGDDLYHSFAIQQCLLQDNKTKLKILEKVSKPVEISNTVSSENKRKILRHFNGYSKKLKTPFQQEVKYFEKDTPHEQLLKHIKPGYAAQVGGKMVVNDGNQIIELNIDKTTFEKLFISNKSGIFQRSIEDCGAVSTIDALLKSPKGKCAIYKLFRQKHGSNEAYIQFKNGECFYDIEKIEDGVDAPSGIQMLEHALSKSREYYTSSIKGIRPLEVLDRIVGSDKYNYFDIPKEDININNLKKIKNSLSQLKNENNFAILESSPDIKENGNFIAPRHFHHISGSDKFGHLFVENPWHTDKREYSQLYEALDPRIISSFEFFKLI